MSSASGSRNGLIRETYTSLAQSELRLEGGGPRSDDSGEELTHRQTPTAWRSKAGSRRHRGLSKTAATSGSEDIVQFSAPIYFVEEEEGEANIDLMRMGNCRGEVSVHFNTRDSSGKDGERYQRAEGVVVFKDGEASASIKVPIIENKAWCATLEFQVEITKPDGCQLGLYLKVCRVKVIDYDAFPSNKFVKEINEGHQSIKGIRGMALVWEFMVLAYGVEGVWWRTLLIAALDQLKNVYLYFTITVSIYLADVLFAESAEGEGETVELLPGIECGLLVPGDAERSAALLGFFIFGPMLALHALDVGKVYMDINGIINNWVRVNLVRKYLNYSEGSRRRVSTAHIQFAMLKDVDNLSTGYVSALRLLRMVGRIVVVLFFAYKESPDAMLIILMLPLVMFVWSVLRLNIYMKAQDRVGAKEVALSNLLNDVTSRYELIAEYFQRPAICDLFIEKQADLNSALVPMNFIYMNNLCVMKTLGPLFTGLYIAIAAELEITGKITLGTFLTTAGLFNNVADTFLKVYELGISVYSMVNPLQGITWYLNLHTDLPALKQMGRKRRAMTRDEREKARVMLAEAPQTDRSVAVDHIPIKLVGMGFTYDPKRAPVFRDVNLELSQGNMVAVISKEDMVGRTTLLKLVGQRLFPSEGLCFIPSHLRVLHVSANPTVMSSSLWDNLTFGARNAGYDRVKEILEAMQLNGVRESIALELQGERLGEKSGPGHGYKETDMSSATLAKIHLARALIMNPEVMVLQRPLSFYDQLSSSRLDILNLIKEYVANRGIGLPTESVWSRRPRTVFFTAETMEEAQEADVIWNLKEDGSIEVLSGKVGSRVAALPSKYSVYSPKGSAMTQMDVAFGAAQVQATGSMLGDEAYYPEESNMPDGDWLAEAEADNVELQGLIADLEARLSDLDEQSDRLRGEARDKSAGAATPSGVARGNQAQTSANEALLKENRSLGSQVSEEQRRCEDHVKSFTHLRQRAHRAELIEKQLVEEGQKLQQTLAGFGLSADAASIRSPRGGSSHERLSSARSGRTGSRASAQAPMPPRRGSRQGSQASEVSVPTRTLRSGQRPGVDTTDQSEKERSPRSQSKQVPSLSGAPQITRRQPSLRACRVCVN